MSPAKNVEANFAYPSRTNTAPANDGAGMPLTISVHADRPHLRGIMRDDAAAAGFRLGEVGDIAALLEGEARPLGEVVLVDCPEANGASLAALARLDLRAAHCGAQLIVSTSVAALDDVFACMDQSGPEILVEPHRADRVIALGRVVAKHSALRVRELSEDDRLMLIRLAEQIGRIAERIDRLGPASPAAGPGDAGDASAFRFETSRRSFSGQPEDESGRLVRATRPPLPDPRLVRKIIRQRQLRARFFDGDMFADPAWDMLLDLTAARAEHARVSVTSLCIASGVPPTTALRWISQMIEAGLFQRIEDDADRRRAFITLTDRAADAMARYFAELGSAASRVI